MLIKKKKTKIISINIRYTKAMTTTATTTTTTKATSNGTHESHAVDWTDTVDDYYKNTIAAAPAVRRQRR